jgi:acyl-CoA thioester hydrolase
MEKIRIEFPDRIHFSTRLQVRVSDLNYGGHLGNDRVLTLAHEARVLFFRSMGYTELDIEGVGIIMTDAAVVYKSEAFLGEELTIDVHVTELSRVGGVLLYRLSCGERLVALVRTGIVFYNYSAKKIAEVPDAFRQKVGR